MSEKQKDRYHTMFPFLADRDNVVLSSVFDDKTLGKMKLLRKNITCEKNGWIVLGSTSWIKGAQAAENWCKANNKKYEVVWNMPYDETLAKLATAEGFVYLPLGGDTCPRMVIEAKLLGCKLQLNDNVLHKDEEWFATDDILSIEDYLYAARRIFWEAIQKQMMYKPTISGYTTTFNCIKQCYPLAQCLQSMLAFCDEVCVVDGGSTDGTWEYIQRLASNEQKIKAKQVVRDLNHPRFAVFDGQQKAEARSMCRSEFCWQMDCDEVVHEDDASRIIELARAMPNQVNIVSLPVIEFWGSAEKVRIDIQPWKWRLSRNLRHITHGIPIALRRIDAAGNVYALPGTDGCDMIDANTGEPLLHMSFHTSDAEHVRQQAMSGNNEALASYEQWFNTVINGLPSVFHYSWYDIARKIRLYRDYWTRHWQNISGDESIDSSTTNMMFDLPWSQVTEKMIEDRAAELAEKLGGWIWHRKWDGQTITPHVKIRRSQPSYMHDFFTKEKCNQHV
jgi:glycosyltransferase involved in cell wall biosynthesis